MKYTLQTALVTTVMGASLAVGALATGVLADGKAARYTDAQSQTQSQTQSQSQAEADRSANELRDTGGSGTDGERASSVAGSGFEIPRYRIASGGGTFSTSGGYSLGGTIGQHEAGAMSGGDFTIVGGFWAGGTDTSEPKCSIPADLNCDGVVDVSDLLILLGAWGTCADPNDCPADLNNDGAVDVSDLLILLGNWG